MFGEISETRKVEAMENEYMIFESRMNHLTLSELNKIDPDPYTPILNKLLDVHRNENKAFLEALEGVAVTLCQQDTEYALNPIKIPSIVFDTANQSWKCRALIGGKMMHIKTSKDKEVVLKARTRYCNRHGIEI